MSKRYYTDYNQYKPNTSIYCPKNKYGYKLNINHPSIKPLYERFKKWKGIGINIPLSDAERFEFESYALKYINNKSKGN